MKVKDAVMIQNHVNQQINWKLNDKLLWEYSNIFKISLYYYVTYINQSINQSM